MELSHRINKGAVLVGGLVALMLAGCAIQSLPGPVRRLPMLVIEHRVRRIAFRRDHVINMQYLVQLPVDYQADTNRLWPMVLHLHGIGEGGTNPKKFEQYGAHKLMTVRTNVPCIVVCPQLPFGFFPFFEGEALQEVVAAVQEEFRVDPQRLHVTGSSVGGYGATTLAARVPNLFASVVSICGGISYPDSTRLRGVPVLAIHGDSDPIVPYTESQRLVELVRRHGGEAELITYKNVGHSIWDRAYNDPQLWNWILTHRREAERETK